MSTAKESNTRSIQRFCELSGVNVTPAQIETFATENGLDLSLKQSLKTRKELAELLTVAYTKPVKTYQNEVTEMQPIESTAIKPAMPAMQMIPKDSENVGTEGNEFGITKVSQAMDLVKATGDDLLIKSAETVASSNSSNRAKILNILNVYRSHSLQSVTLLKTGIQMINQEKEAAFDDINQLLKDYAAKSNADLEEIKNILTTSSNAADEEMNSFFNSFK